MKKLILRLLSCSFCVIFVFISVVIGSAAEDYEGKCGDDAQFYFEAETGVLDIWGSGEISVPFADNKAVKKIYIENGITGICENAFAGCDMADYVFITKTVSSIKSNAFKNCGKLKEISLPKGLSELGSGVFSGCDGLEKIRIPDVLTVIPSDSFKGCTSLKSVILPKSIEEIGENAFNQCSSLESVYYNGTENDMKNIIKADNCFGNAEIQFITPVFSVESSFSNGIFTASLILESGLFNAADVSVTKNGSITLKRVSSGAGITSASNNDLSLISLASSDCVEEGTVVLKAQFNASSCEGYNVRFRILSCYASVEGEDIEVFPQTSIGVRGSHTYEDYVITSYPNEKSPGSCYSICSVCEKESIISLPFALSRCRGEDNILFTEFYGKDTGCFIKENVLSGYSVQAEAFKGRFLGTGSTVSVTYSQGVTAEYTVSLLGDADGDGLCDACDSVIMSCIEQGLINENDVSRAVKYSSDINSDGKTDITDYEYAFNKGLFLSV